MNKFIKQMPVLSHVSTTLKTWKSCVVCRGGRTVCVRSRHNNIITHKYCVSTASSSGLPTFDINEAGSTILSTKITIDANEKTSTTAATPPVISDTALANDAEITFDIDVAGTGAVGAYVYLIGTQT